MADRFVKATPQFEFGGTYSKLGGTGDLKYLTETNHSTSSIPYFQKTGVGSARIEQSGTNLVIPAVDQTNWLSAYYFDNDSTPGEYCRIVLIDAGVNKIFKQFYPVSGQTVGAGWTTLPQGTATWATFSGSPTFPFTANWVDIYWPQSEGIGNMPAPDAMFTDSFDVTENYICFCFDDGHSTDYTIAKDVLASKGYVGTSFVIESEPVFSPLTDVQMQGLVAAGWEIGCHHETNFTTFTEKQVLDALTSCCNYVQTSIGQWPSSFAWPESAVDAASLLGAQRAPLQYGRRGFWDVGDGMTPTGIRGQERLGVRGDTLNTNTVATIKGEIDDCIANGKSLITISHQVVESGAVTTQINTAQLQEVADYAYSKGMVGLTFSEFARRLQADTANS